jgi:hypothetical protein
MGATPKLLEDGIPDDAFKPLTGDDKTTVASWKKDNKKHREHGVFTLFGGSGVEAVTPLATDFAGVESISEEDLQAVQKKATRWFELVASGAFRDAVFVADTWCAAFVAPKNEAATRITDEEFRIARDNPVDTRPEVRALVTRLASEYAFLHWHLAFPVVFSNGGFDIVLGNPPWERIKMSQEEFFSSRSIEIAELSGAKRTTAIKALEKEDPRLWDDFQESLRRSESTGHFIRNSGRFPLCGRGDINTYSIFAEAMRDTVSPTGRVGVIVQTGIATDDTTKYFFGDIVNRRQLVSLYAFDHRTSYFGKVQMQFCLLTLSGGAAPTEEMSFAFGLMLTSDLYIKDRVFTLTPEDLFLINPNTRTAPLFFNRRDADITKEIYRRNSVLVTDSDPDGNQWGVYYLRLVHYDDHAGLLIDKPTTGDLERVYESKMIHQFEHRWADWKDSPLPVGKATTKDLPDSFRESESYRSVPRYWMESSDFKSIIDKYQYGLKWLMGYRDVARSSDIRTLIAAALPYGPASVNVPVLGIKSASDGVVLLAAFNSFVLDFVARQSVGGMHVTFGIVKQLPLPAPETMSAKAGWSELSVISWLAPRVLELTYTAVDLRGFGEDLGYAGRPFIWDSSRREVIRAEIDAAMFCLYGIDREDIAYIMDTFPIVRRKDEAAYGEFRTKRLILERYDALAQAVATGTEYQTALQPPPADPMCAHHPK